MKICFLDNVKTPYTSKDIYTNKIRGAENVVLNLAREISNLNHDVTIYNNCENNTKIDNINWVNINNINDNPYFDLAVSNNDIRLFDCINASRKVAISHSIQSIEKFIRKGQFFAYIKHKPKIVLLSKYHKENRNYLLRMFGFFNIDWAVDKIFLEADTNANVINNQAIFTSYSDRNLHLLIKIWKEYIFTQSNNIKLLITPVSADYTKYNIYNRLFSDKSKLISDILNSRIYLIPGHKAELYCIAAEEARELCVPIVTLGIGCLKERVNHGITGLIAKNEKEFADYTIQLFNDNVLWNNIKKNLLSLRGSKQWKNIAEQFIKNSY
tara:strand:+ start:276 stop:1253 length:978 start_codon:yes stop_codon:yes gene_type:complete